MAPSSNLSSNALLRMMQICFYLCILKSYVFADVYKFESLGSFDIGERKSMSIGSSAFLYLKRQDSNTYTAQLRSFSLSVTGKWPIPNQQLDETCASFQKIKNSLEKPFVVNLDDNGKFQSLKVSTDDVDLSTNIKLFLATTMQVNKQRLEESSFTENERLRFGDCDVLNKVQKQGDNKYSIRFNYQPDTCHGLEGVYQNDKEYLNNICRDFSQRSSYYSSLSYADANVELEDGQTKFTSFTSNGRISYMPWKSKQDFFFSSYFARANPINRDGSPEELLDSEAKEVTELQYISVNRDIIENGSTNTGLNEFYRAVACQALKYNGYAAIINESIKCWQESNK